MTSILSMDESIATTMKIKVPQFTTGPDQHFIKTVKDEFIDYYIKDGKYFRNHVTYHEPFTTVFLKFDKIFNLLASSNMNKTDRSNKISEISIKLISQIPYIMIELDLVLPSLLKTLNWEYCKLDYSNYDMSQFSGMDDSGPTPVPTFGASACMFIMYIKSIPGSIPMHKPNVTNTDNKPEPKVVINIAGEYLNAARRGAVNKIEIHESKKDDTVTTTTTTVSNELDENTNIRVDDIKITEVKPKVVSKGKRPTK